MGSTPIRAATYSDKKRCGVCKELKPVSDFNKHNQRTGYLYRCKPCQRTYSSAHYHLNSDRYKARRDARKKMLREMVVQLKARPCADCKKSYPPYVMDFDHRDPSSKLFGMGEATSGGRNIDKILSEIDKCDVICANCHRERTYGSGRERVAKHRRKAG